jgi:hypothetical protein
MVMRPKPIFSVELFKDRGIESLALIAHGNDQRTIGTGQNDLAAFYFGMLEAIEEKLLDSAKQKDLQRGDIDLKASGDLQIDLHSELLIHLRRQATLNLRQGPIGAGPQGSVRVTSGAIW